MIRTPTYYSKLFSEAEYILKEKRKQANRKPANLPKEENVQKLKVYLERAIPLLAEKGVKK